MLIVVSFSEVKKTVKIKGTKVKQTCKWEYWKFGMAEILRKIILLAHIYCLWYSTVVLSIFIYPSFENSATPENSVISDDSSNAMKYRLYYIADSDESVTIFNWESFYVTYLNFLIQADIQFNGIPCNRSMWCKIHHVMY